MKETGFLKFGYPVDHLALGEVPQIKYALIINKGRKNADAKLSVKLLSKWIINLYVFKMISSMRFKHNIIIFFSLSILKKNLLC